MNQNSEPTHPIHNYCCSQAVFSISDKLLALQFCPFQGGMNWKHQCGIIQPCIISAFGGNTFVSMAMVMGKTLQLYVSPPREWNTRKYGMDEK